MAPRLAPTSRIIANVYVDETRTDAMVPRCSLAACCRRSRTSVSDQGTMSEASGEEQ